MENFNLGLLIFGEGFETPAEFVDLIIKAEELGYHRVWLDEHYRFNSLWCNPEPVLPIALSYTTNIKVGCAGLLMPLHSAFRVANSFKVLNAFFPERVELGYASGQTGFEHLNDLLSDITKNFGNQITDTHHYLQNNIDLVSQNIPVAPYGSPLPDEWLLVGSYKALSLALENQMNVSRSIFHQGLDISPQKTQLLDFKKKFADKHGYEPQITLAFSGVCHETKSRAIETYEKSCFSKNTFINANIIGTPEDFEHTMLSYTEDYGINNFVFLNLAESPQDKLLAMEMLSVQHVY